jgi:hypothetical protein
MPESTFIREAVGPRATPTDSEAAAPSESEVQAEKSPGEAHHELDEQGAYTSVPKRGCLSRLRPFKGIYKTKSSVITLLARQVTPPLDPFLSLTHITLAQAHAIAIHANRVLGGPPVRHGNHLSRTPRGLRLRHFRLATLPARIFYVVSWLICKLTKFPFTALTLLLWV